MSLNSQLEAELQGILPGASLDITELADVPELRLWLLNDNYPQQDLDAEGVRTVMANPLYWVFCWASGQVMAKFLLDSPGWVRGKRVLDFGCGSGVAGIAAALAGAREVIACDIDPLALQAASLNAELNRIELTLVDDFESVTGSIDLILVADVLYDRSNLPWLDRFVGRAGKVLIADSRVKDFDVPPYREIARLESCTWPDLDESPEFRDVRIYGTDG